MAVDASADPNFTIVMRGYERDEVDAYLRDVLAETSRLGERVSELESELASARARAKEASTPQDGFKQLGEETTRILVAAETAAREMREKAERQADAELAAADKAARERVEQASDHADRIVAEAESRQADVEAEIRRLESVRAELVDRLRAAISTTERAIGEAPSRADATAAVSSAPAATGPAPAVEVEEPAVEEEPPAAVEQDTEEVVEDAPEAAATDTSDSYLDELDLNDIVLDDLDTEAADPATEVADEVDADEDADEDIESVRVIEAPRTEEEPEPEPAPAPEAVAEEVGSGADRGAVEAALAEADAAAGRAPAPAPVVDADPLMLRERSLAGVRPGMLRRLRRSLQELQNGVLESVRVRTDDNVVEDLLPTDAESGALADVARVFLDAGYRAGRADAPVLTGGDALQDPPTDTTLVGDTADALAREVLAELRTTLAPSLRAGIEAVEPDASLSERVGEVFRDLKGPVVETVVDRHLTRTYGRATLDGWSEEGIGRVQWVLGDETRCPEGVCRANEAEGAITLGDDFSSGHAVPLAHDGCTCALQPA